MTGIPNALPKRLREAARLARRSMPPAAAAMVEAAADRIDPPVVVRVALTYDLRVSGAAAEEVVAALTVGVPEFGFTFERTEPLEAEITDVELASIDLEVL